AVAIGIEGVESDFHSFKERQPFDVVDGNAVLEREPGVVGPQRQAAAGGQAPQVNLDAASDLGSDNAGGIAINDPIELAIANAGCLAAPVDDRLSCCFRQALNAHRS